MNNEYEHINILIADDKRLIRDALKNIFDTAPEMTVVAEARNGDEVTRQLRCRNVDIVVLDISMPGKNGLEILTEVKEEFPDLPVLILSMHNEKHIIALAREKGAAGYLTKGTAPAKIIDTVRKLAHGKVA